MLAMIDFDIKGTHGVGSFQLFFVGSVAFIRQMRINLWLV